MPKKGVRRRYERRGVRGRWTLAGILASALSAACASAPPAGMRVEKITAPSLPSPNEVLVVTPPSYDASPGRRYPVLYFLHDGYGDGRSLERRGVAADALARMRDGRLPEFLIVAPDGPGTWFSDSNDGVRRFEQYLARDLPRAIESKYRVLPAKASRGITGISMGGYGSVKTALRHPELYGAVSALSGAIIPFAWDELPRYSLVARWTLMRTFGKTKENNSLDANDAWLMLWRLCYDAPPFSVELRAGTEDFYGLDRVAAQYGMLLNERGIPTTVVLEPGGHDWSYWRRAMMDILAWHGARFEYDRPAAGERREKESLMHTAPSNGHRLVLFDIDGTLLSAGRVARDAILRSLQDSFGWRYSPDHEDRGRFDFSGKTDPQIVRELVFDDVGAERFEQGLPRALELYLEELERQLLPGTVAAKPGIDTLLERLAADPRVTLGLLTGNLERGARLKLAPPGFNRYFPFGAFGSDSADRYLLPPIAVARAHAHSGRRFEGKSVVVVGDSVHDVACGRSLGVRSVAVATGITSVERLEAERPDALFESFADTDRAFAAIVE